MVRVDDGTFWMGAQSEDASAPNYDPDAAANEGPVHEERLSDYYIGQTEVTEALWYAVVI